MGIEPTFLEVVSGVLNKCQMANRGLHLADCFVRTTSDHTVELQAGASRIPRMVEAQRIERWSGSSKPPVLPLNDAPSKLCWKAR